MRHILAIDQGTSSTRSIVFDELGKMVGIDQKEHKQFYPKPSWVEHDPLEIKNNVLETMHNAVKNARLEWKDIESIGITNQRETVVAWDGSNGKPLYNAIVWQCRRTTPFVKKLKKEGYADEIHKKTGLVMDAYFSGTKMHWLLNNVDKVKNNEQPKFGTIDSWIIKFLSGEHATDASNASRTMLYNLNSMQFDEELAEILQVPIESLPEVKENAADPFGYYNIEGRSIPIRGVLGDQQSALFGQTGFNTGDIKTTYGTGNFSLLNTGSMAKFSQNGLLTTVGWQIDGKATYALEGSVFVTGASIRWLRDGLHLFDHYDQMEELIKMESNSNGVYFVPAFVGLGAPHWNATASGSMFGLSGGSNPSHIIHATLDAIAYQTQELIELMMQESEIEITEMAVDGGATKSTSLMQKQADISQLRIRIPQNIETTALGAAMMAGYKIIWDDLNAMNHINPLEQEFNPNQPADKMKEGRVFWNQAVERSKDWY
ncbi:MAG: glycerol kinase GlpK [Candidatus Heimdallarchaeota archaeon]|nr:glycerol kinase GlpK [Candidatus Heimdallarchaeota archaeon]